MFNGRLLREIRLERGMSQKRLAGMLQVNKSLISHWEHGRKVPSLHCLKALSDILRVDVVHFLE